MTDKQRHFAVSESLNYSDVDAFISDVALSDAFDGVEIGDNLIDELRELWSVAHMSMRDIRSKTGLSQAKFAEKLLIPTRTIESWESKTAEKRTCPLYVKFLIYNFLFKK